MKTYRRTTDSGFGYPGLVWLLAGLLAGMLHLPAAWAQDHPADQAVLQTSRQILKEIGPRKEELRNNTQKLHQLVEKLIAPHFDFNTISRRVLGRAWKEASPDQQADFSEAFKRLLIRTYSTALLEYSGEEIEWQPIEAGKDAEKVLKKAEVTLASGQTVPMQWGLHKVKDTWKVYDINIDGISLVTNYRSVFASEVRKNGLDALIRRLDEKNTTDAAG